MKAFSRSGPVLSHRWFIGALALLFLPGCALTPGAGEGNASNAETVDIGYGSVDKDHQVGSVTTIDGQEEYTETTRTLAEMLARVPGVKVVDYGGGDIRVRVRQSNSILGGEDPLFVVDGMVFIGGLSSINPNTVESITVLKNAGETAIYGSRGSNGVILIKTKSGTN
jgi:TonB-dependent SusC/RagA subfamily outer membrane receptor